MHLVTVNCKIVMRLTTAFPSFVTKYRDKFITYIFSFCNVCVYKCCYLSLHGVCECVNSSQKLSNTVVRWTVELWNLTELRMTGHSFLSFF